MFQFNTMICSWTKCNYMSLINIIEDYKFNSGTICACETNDGPNCKMPLMELQFRKIYVITACIIIDVNQFSWLVNCNGDTFNSIISISYVPHMCWRWCQNADDALYCRLHCWSLRSLKLCYSLCLYTKS